MTFFSVSTFTQRPNAKGGVIIEPVSNTDIVVHWKSGGGSTLDDTRARTNASGVASLSTPANFMQLGLPTGADGSIVATNGSMVGYGTVSVNLWGEPSPQRIPIEMSADAEGNLKNIVSRAGSTVKNAGIIVTVALIALAVVVVSIRGVIKR
jgi:hypothetical protein